MHISEFDNSEFVRKEDLDKPELITITDVEQRMMTNRDTGKEQKKCVLHFKEPIKGKTAFIVNKTNRLSIARIVGSLDTDNWKGREVVLYVDPTVIMGGKETGGIRVRAPRKNRRYSQKQTRKSTSTKNENRPRWYPLPWPVPNQVRDRV
jgi:hypothetical protein